MTTANGILDKTNVPDTQNTSNAVSGQLGFRSVSPVAKQIQAYGLPPESVLSIAVKVHEKVGERGAYVITKDLIASHPSLPAPRFVNLESREMKENDFEALLQSGVSPFNMEDSLSDDAIIQALKEPSRLSEKPPSKISFVSDNVFRSQAQVRHIPGSNDLSLQITKITDHPSQPVPVTETIEERVISAADFDRILSQAPSFSRSDDSFESILAEQGVDLSTPARKDDSLESILAEKGIHFSRPGDMQVQPVGGPGYILDKYLFNPISRGLHWIQHQGTWVADSHYREQYNKAVKVCQSEKYPYQVYSEEQVKAQLAEVSRLGSQMGHNILDQRISEINLFTTIGALGGKGSALIKALTTTSAIIQNMQTHGPESERIKSEWTRENKLLRSMIEKNQDASYQESLRTNYEPKLYFKTNLTKEEERMSLWGVDFLVDNNGFQFGISIENAF